jgi:hypothetical protein
MNKVKWLKVLNPILFISLVVQIVTSIMIVMRLFMSKINAILEIHENNGIFLIVLIVGHLFLNWGWVKSTFFSKK